MKTNPTSPWFVIINDNGNILNRLTANGMGNIQKPKEAQWIMLEEMSSQVAFGSHSKVALMVQEAGRILKVPPIIYIIW